MEEYRIYYESIEQAENYIKPLFKVNNEKIKLVKLTSNCKRLSSSIASLVSLKNPDILITKIQENLEYPLIFIEFSNAVFTEDHELQRFDGMIASAKNNCVYIKISPLNKTSQSGAHGGNTHFDYLNSYSAILKRFDKLFYHFDWPCDKKGDLEVNKEYLSCPKKINPFNNFMKVFSNFVDQNKINSVWEEEFTKKLLKLKVFKEWSDSVKNNISLSLSRFNSTRTTWLSNKNQLILKLNRFGHAMDPERGMLSYYGTIHDNVSSKMIFDKYNSAWFKATSSESKIKDYIKTNGLTTSKDFLFCFIYGSGLNSIKDFLGIYANLGKNLPYQEIDLSRCIDQNYDHLNKPMRTLFDFSKELLIYDTSSKLVLRLFWSKKERVIKFQEKLSKLKVKDYLEEDDVTYITIHNILKKNKFKILASSFPGAQGDRVILVNPHTGRAQKRTYLDVVAYLPKKFTAIQENKSPFNSKKVNDDIKKVCLFKTNKEHISAVDEFRKRYDSNAPSIIKVGVGFWAKKEFAAAQLQSLNLSQLDYFIFIDSKMKKWQIWCSSDKKLFGKTSGEVKLPKTWEVE